MCALRPLNASEASTSTVPFARSAQTVISPANSHHGAPSSTAHTSMARPGSQSTSRPSASYWAQVPARLSNVIASSPAAMRPSASGWPVVIVRPCTQHDASTWSDEIVAGSSQM